MTNRKPFLTARWTNLAMLTWQVGPGMLDPLLPPGCRLDLFEGRALVSLVGFNFSDTRVFGRRWPGYTNFPEINLRFYVRCGDDHGVCFIREFVGLRTVATLARAFYNEPYRIAPLASRVESLAGNIHVDHRLTVGRQTHSVRIDASAETACPAAGGIECFLKDQEWGFGTSRRRRLIRYRVLHPVWRTHAVNSFDLQWDWKAVYGPAWECLQDQPPVSVSLIEGSAVQLFPHMAGK